MQILNPGLEDYHCHSSNYSDGVDTIADLVRTAGEIKLTKLAITDHSQATIDALGIAKKIPRFNLSRWKNIYNNGVEVLFGIEADLLNEQGDICDHIQDIKSDFLILSAHHRVYKDSFNTITEAHLKAIERYHQKIEFIGHLCFKKFAPYLDVKRVVQAANHYEIPLEFNCANFVYHKTDMDKLHLMFRKADQIYVNSDAHTISELKELREIGFEYLREKRFLKAQKD